jgi:hypothetical protein
VDVADIPVMIIVGHVEGRRAASGPIRSESVFERDVFVYQEPEKSKRIISRRRVPFIKKVTPRAKPARLTMIISEPSFSGLKKALVHRWKCGKARKYQNDPLRIRLLFC